MFKDHGRVRPRVRSTTGIGALAMVLLSLAAVPARAEVFGAETFSLDNGLQVVVIEQPGVPVVSHMVWYKVGAADEPPGKSGIAHFLEHLMFKGTDDLEPGEASRIIARNGGQENAFTSMDYTGYYQNVAVDRLGLVMKLEADRMADLVLTDDVVLPERDVILEERRSRTDNDPGSQLSEQTTAALFQNHPYGIPVIGWEHEMRGLTTTDAIDFYRTWYRPNNAVLVVSGAVTVEQVRDLAEEHYGPLEPGDVPARQRPQEPPQLAERRVTLESPLAGQPSFSRRYLAPSYNRGIPGGQGTEPVGSEHVYALQVLTEILGGGSTSRLYRTLVVEDAAASSAGSWYGASDFDLSSFGLYASPLPGRTTPEDLDAVEAAVDAVVADLVDGGVTEDEVKRAKRRMIASAVYARDSLGTGGRVIGEALTTGQTVADVEAWPDRIQAVTVEQVNAAARAVFDRRRAVTSRLLPKPAS